MNKVAYKKEANKVGLWFCSVTFLFMTIGLVVLFCINLHDKKLTVSLAVELVADILFVLILCFSLVSNRLFYRSIVNIEKITYEDDTTSLNFKVNWLIHIIAMSYSLIIFFLIPSCHSMANDISWKSGLLKSLALNLAIFLYNIVFIYLYLYTFNYMLNINSDFKAALSDELAKVETQSENSESK